MPLPKKPTPKFTMTRELFGYFVKIIETYASAVKQDGQYRHVADPARERARIEPIAHAALEEIVKARIEIEN